MLTSDEIPASAGIGAVYSAPHTTIYDPDPMQIEPAPIDSAPTEPAASPTTAPAPMPAATNSGDPSGRRITVNSLGYKSKDDAKKLFDLMIQGDGDAFGMFGATHMLAGDCKGLNVGDEVHMNEFSLWSGMACVRPTGDPDCYWVQSYAVGEKGSS